MGDGRESVLRLRRHGRMHRAGHQAVALQAAQGQGEHPAADALDAALQFGEPDGAVRGGAEDLHAPLPATLSRTSRTGQARAFTAWAATPVFRWDIGPPPYAGPHGHSRWSPLQDVHQGEDEERGSHVGPGGRFAGSGGPGHAGGEAHRRSARPGRGADPGHRGRLPAGVPGGDGDRRGGAGAGGGGAAGRGAGEVAPPAPATVPSPQRAPKWLLLSSAHSRNDRAARPSTSGTSAVTVALCPSRT